MVIIDRGKVSEMTVVMQLLEMGWQVSLPFSDSCCYDLISESNEGLKRIQVKTVRCDRPTKPEIYLVKSTSRKKYTKSEVDCFIGVLGSSCYLVTDTEGRSSTSPFKHKKIQDHPWFKQKEVLP